jgi:hypothetical protein
MKSHQAREHELETVGRRPVSLNNVANRPDLQGAPRRGLTLIGPTNLRSIVVEHERRIAEDGFFEVRSLLIVVTSADSVTKW